MRKSSIIFLVISLLMLLALIGCTNSEYQTVRLSEVTRSVFYAPQYVALNKGFFEEEGLKIELTNGQGADKVMTAVLSDQVDIGFSGPEAAIYVYNQGKEDHAVVFAQLTKRDGSFLIGRNEEPDFMWSNVRGKTIIGGRKGGVPEMTLEYVLRQNNLTPREDVDIDTSIQFALMAPAFTGGKGDYVTLFEPVASAIEKEGKGYIVASIGKESGEIPYTAYYAKKSYIENNKDIIQKFTNAIFKGQKWVENNSPEEIAEVIKPSFPDSDIETLTTVAKRYKDTDVWCKDPFMSKESLQLLQKVMEMAGELERQANYEELVTTDFAKKVIEN